LPGCIVATVRRLRQHHLELDGIQLQLRRGFAQGFQQWQPARVALERPKHRVLRIERTIFFRRRPGQPLEGAIRLTRPGVHVRHFGGPLVAPALDQFIQPGPVLCLSAQCMRGQRSALDTVFLVAFPRERHQRGSRLILEQQGRADPVVRADIARTQAQGGFQRRDGIVVAAGQEVIGAQVGVADRVDRILGDGVFLQDDGLVQAAERVQQHGGIADDGEIGRGQLQGALDMPGGLRQVLVKQHRDPAEQRVRLGGVRVDGQGPLRRLVGQGRALLERQQAIAHLAGIVARQAMPGGGVIGVDGQRLLVQGIRLREGLGGDLASQVAGLQVQRVGFRVGLLRLRNPAQQRELELSDDRRGDLVLDGENVIQRPIPGLRPQLGVGAGIDQLRRDPQHVAGPAHRALEDMRHVQLPGDFGDRDVLALERERRGARDHPELGNLRQQVQQLLGNAVREVLLLGIGTPVHKGQHRDGLVGGDGGPRGRGRDAVAGHPRKDVGGLRPVGLREHRADAEREHGDEQQARLAFQRGPGRRSPRPGRARRRPGAPRIRRGTQLARQHPPDALEALAAGIFVPVVQVDGVHGAEINRQLGLAEAHRDQHAPVRRVPGFPAHPAGAHRVRCPDDDHGTRVLEGVRDQRVEFLAGRNLGIPPDRPAFRLERRDQRRDSRVINASI
jgi:hypothetical protein